MRRAPVLLLLASMILAGCTNSTPDADGDGDLVNDEAEREGKLIEVTTLSGVESRHVTSDPTLADTDGDGLLDGDELLVRETDPRDVDTDDDGLLDGDDRVPPDDAAASAWRAAGIIDVNGTFLGELDACPAGGAQLRPNVASSDLPLPDELLDGEEVRGWDVTVRGSTRHVSSDPCAADTDRDGLVDHDEKVRSADPRNADTDGDGVQDGADGDPLWDLALGFADLDVELDGPNATHVRVVFTAGSATADLISPGNGSATLDVPDQAGGGELPVSLILAAEDLRTGEPLALFDDPRGAIVVFDILAGSVEGAQTSGQELRFAGRDGSMTMTWSVVRR